MSTTEYIKTNRGFTIVELLIVIVVIGILAALVVVTYNGIQLRAKNADATSELRNIKTAMLLYRADYGTLPNGADFWSGNTMPPTANFGSQIINNLKNLGYLSTSDVATDAWGQYYWYDNNDCTFGQSGNTALRSVGPDGLNFTGDDVAITIVTTC